MKVKFYAWLADRLPHKLISAAAIRMFVHATTGEYETQEVPSVTIMEALGRWETKT
jgi:hypothetical protein